MVPRPTAPDPLVICTIAGNTTSEDMEAIRSAHPNFGTDDDDDDTLAVEMFQRHMQQLQERRGRHTHGHRDI